MAKKAAASAWRGRCLMTGESALEVVDGRREQPKAPFLAREASSQWACCGQATWSWSWGCESWLGAKESNAPKVEATGISYDVMVRGPLENCNEETPCKQKRLPCHLRSEKKRRILEVIRKYRAQVQSQAASNISSSRKAVECLVSRQGLGRTRILLEILMLILVLRRSLRG